MKTTTETLTTLLDRPREILNRSDDLFALAIKVLRDHIFEGDPRCAEQELFGALEALERIKREIIQAEELLDGLPRDFEKTTEAVEVRQ